MLTMMKPKNLLLTQNFILSFISGITVTEFELLQSQLILALVEAKREAPHILTLWFEEPEDSMLGVLLNSLIAKTGTIFIQLDNFDSTGKRINIKKFTGCKATKFTYELNYATNESCKYMVVFDADKLDFS